MGITIILIILISALMISFNALYVAGEFAAVSARKSRVQQAAQSGNRLAELLLPVLSDARKLDSYIAASQVGITISSIVLGIYGQQQIVKLIRPYMQDLPVLDAAAAGSISALLVLILLTTLQVVLGELVPKSVALRYPEKVAMFTVIPMRWSADVVLRPLIVLLNGSGTLILRLLGVTSSHDHHHVHSPEEIKILIGASSAGGLIDADDRRLLNNAFRIGVLRAAEVVVPRNRLTAVPVDMPVSEVLQLVSASSHTRIPVYENDIDHVLGFVHLKDVFATYSRQKDDGDLRSLIRQAPFVPHTMLVNDVWLTMNQADSYIAFVFGEYGGLTGMITREDLIEELFGEVQDEFDEERAIVTPQGNNRYIVRSDVAIALLNEELNLDLPTESARTLGGLILAQLGTLPKLGDRVSVDNVSLEVQSAEPAVYQVLMTLRPAEPVSPDTEVKS